MCSQITLKGNKSTTKTHESGRIQKGRVVTKESVYKHRLKPDGLREKGEHNYWK